MSRPKTLQEARQELKDYFPKLNQEEHALHLDFYADASFTLLSKDAVDGGLRYLDILMEKKLEERVGPQKLSTAATEFVNYYEGDRGEKLPVYRKLMTEAITDFERRVGFVDKVPNLLRELGTKEFGSLLRDGAHWKDPGAGVQHGEFTHRIQWLIIITSEVRQNITLSGYKAFTEIVNFNNRVEGEAFDPKKFVPLWGALCDRSIDTDLHVDTDPVGRLKHSCDMEDFRCPEWLCPYIISEENRKNWPLLGTFLFARTKKREDFVDRAVQLEYAIKKLKIPAEKAVEYRKTLQTKVDDKDRKAFVKSVLNAHGAKTGVVVA